jgi:hypothetical protein
MSITWLRDMDEVFGTHRVVPALPFAGFGDVDHALVGPGGVYALESKWTSTTWTIDADRRCADLDRAFVQARLGARKIQSSLLSHHLVAQVRPVVVIWGKGAPTPANGWTEFDQVIIVAGSQGRSWTRGAWSDHLELSDTEAIFEALRTDLERRVDRRPPSGDKKGGAAQVEGANRG